LVGPVLAAKLLGEVGDIRRFATKACFAAHNGTAPLEVSSGQVVRHRLSRTGNRKLNHALGESPGSERRCAGRHRWATGRRVRVS
jgi:transposase